MKLVHILTISSPLAGDVESGVKSCLKICCDQDCLKTRKLVYCPTRSGASSQKSFYSSHCEGSQESICAGNDVQYACILIKTRTGQVVVEDSGGLKIAVVIYEL